MLNLTSQQLREAADLQDKIEALNTELAQILGNELPVVRETTTAEIPAKLGRPAKAGKRTMSPAHKAAIRAALAMRWAKHNAGKGKPAPEVAKPQKPGKRGPKKGGMSAEGKARIIVAQKARWAKYNAAKPAPEPAKKRKMSRAGRAAIIAAVKARWARIRAGKGKK